MKRLLVASALAGSCLLALQGCAGGNEPGILFTLSVSIDPASTGTGYVQSSDDEIDCEPDCGFDYDENEMVELGAFPTLGSVFGGWTGDCGGILRFVTFRMDRDRACIARFDRGALLSVARDPVSTGNGTVTGDSGIVCGTGGTVCAATFAVNDSASLAVTADSGSTFGGWGGDCAAFGTNLSIRVKMDVDKDCTLRYDAPAAGGVLSPRGTYNFAFRVEAGGFSGNKAFVAAYDAVNTEGTTIDFSNPDNPTSPAGAEFSTCSGARAAAIYFSPFAPYNQDVFHATCAVSLEGSITPTLGGFTQIAFYNFAPGAVERRPDTTVIGIVDFEFGRYHLWDLNFTAPGSPATINLTPAGRRGCPFRQVIKDSIAYVVGQEGTPGTSTADCDNWRGLWRVNLKTQMVIDHIPFGTKPRYVQYGSDDMVYVTDFEEDKVYVIDPVTGAVDRSFAAGDGPTGFKLTLDASRLIVANWNTNLVKVFDLSTDQEIDSKNSGGFQPVDVYLSGITVGVLNFGNASTQIGGSLRFYDLAP